MVARRVILGALWTASCWLTMAGSVVAQEFPSRPIKIICAFAAGTAVDTLARVVAQDLSEQMKVPVLVENRPGANGSIASEAVAKSPPDGYTLVTGTNSTHAANATLFRNLAYDPVRDFEPVAFLSRLPSLLVASPGVPFRTFPEFIAYARANPGKLSYGTANSTSLMVGESIKSLAGIDMVAVPYKSTPLAINDVISGQIPLMVVEALMASTHVKSGKLLGLATPLASAIPLLPDVPPIAATLPGFEVSGWVGLFAPASTPAVVVERLASEVRRSLQKQSTRTRLEQLGFVTPAMTRVEFGAFVRAEKERWAKRIKELGIKVQ